MKLLLLLRWMLQRWQWLDMILEMLLMLVAQRTNHLRRPIVVSMAKHLPGLKHNTHN